MSKLIIYGKNSCGWCDKALELAEENNISVSYKKVEDPETRQLLLSIDPDVKTVPQIYYGNEKIGGYEEFKEWVTNKYNKYL